jgi:hypothetical protein
MHNRAHSVKILTPLWQNSRHYEQTDHARKGHIKNTKENVCNSYKYSDELIVVDEKKIVKTSSIKLWFIQINHHRQRYMHRQETLHIHITHVQSTTEHPSNTMYSTGIHTTLYYVCRRIHGLQLQDSFKFYIVNCRYHSEGHLYIFLYFPS